VRRVVAAEELTRRRRQLLATLQAGVLLPVFGQAFAQRLRAVPAFETMHRYIDASSIAR
jgi:hypothetical protein